MATDTHSTIESFNRSLAARVRELERKQNCTSEIIIEMRRQLRELQRQIGARQ